MSRFFSVIAVGVATATTSTATAAVSPSPLNVNNLTTAAGIQASIEADPEIYSLCGVDITEGDQWAARYPNPDLCVANCLPQTGCNAATWTRFEGGTCYFKRLVGGKGWVPNRHVNARPNAGAVSFIRREDISPYWILNSEPDFDMPGNDLTHFEDPSGDSCYSACQAIDKCSAYTWSGYNGGTCWLKTKSSPYVPSPGSRTHMMTRPGYPGYCLAYL